MWKNKRFTNAELRRMLKGFPKGLGFKALWGFDPHCTEVNVMYGMKHKHPVFTMEVATEHWSEKEAVRQLLEAMGKFLHLRQGEVGVMRCFARAMAEYDGKSEEYQQYELQAMVYLECLESWYEEWEKNGRKVNDHAD